MISDPGRLIADAAYGSANAWMALGPQHQTPYFPVLGQSSANNRHMPAPT